MAVDLHPVETGKLTGKVVFKVTYTKADGSAGELQNPQTWTLSEPDLVTGTDMGMTSPGVFEFSIVHKGSAGTLQITSDPVDGDLGEGVLQLGPFSETVNVLAPLGAVAGNLTASAETAP
jgi:hypothetical protein